MNKLMQYWVMIVIFWKVPAWLYRGMRRGGSDPNMKPEVTYEIDCACTCEIND